MRPGTIARLTSRRGGLRSGPADRRTVSAPRSAFGFAIGVTRKTNGRTDRTCVGTPTNGNAISQSKGIRQPDVEVGREEDGARTGHGRKRVQSEALPAPQTMGGSERRWSTGRTPANTAGRGNGSIDPGGWGTALVRVERARLANATGRAGSTHSFVLSRQGLPVRSRVRTRPADAPHGSCASRVTNTRTIRSVIAAMVISPIGEVYPIRPAGRNLVTGILDSGSALATPVRQRLAGCLPRVSLGLALGRRK